MKINYLLKSKDKFKWRKKEIKCKNNLNNKVKGPNKYF